MFRATDCEKLKFKHNLRHFLIASFLCLRFFILLGIVIRLQHSEKALKTLSSKVFMLIFVFGYMLISQMDLSDS